MQLLLNSNTQVMFLHTEFPNMAMNLKMDNHVQRKANILNKQFQGQDYKIHDKYNIHLLQNNHGHQ